MIVEVRCILVHQTLIWFSPINCSHQHTDHNDIYINSVHVHLCTSPADICLIYVHSYTHICPQWKKIAFDGRQVHCTLDLVSISVNISCIADLYISPYLSIVRCTVHDLVFIFYQWHPHFFRVPAVHSQG